MLIDNLFMILTIKLEDDIDYLIADYLIKNGRLMTTQKKKDILIRMGISDTTLTRFCKSLGYKNFTDLGFALYDEFVNMTDYHFADVEEFKEVDKYLKDKNRIVVIGDHQSKSCLVPYKKVFNAINIPLAFSLLPESSVQSLYRYQPDEKTLIIYLSLFNSNISWSVKNREEYKGIVRYIKERHVPIIYIGRILWEEDDFFYVPLNSQKDQSYQIYQLCRFFEKIYNCLEKSQKQGK